MRVLLAPLNWGLGHASRCIPLVSRFLDEGHEVVLAGDGDSLLLLRKHFPSLPYFTLAPLNLRYSGSSSQVGAMLRALPAILRFSVADHRILKHILRDNRFDLVVSDNRFGLFSRNTRCVYITHQLLVLLPRRLRFLQRTLQRLHYAVIRRYAECWIPDDEQQPGLAGCMSHPSAIPSNATYIGPLSRFSGLNVNTSFPAKYDVVAVLSGPEPQRTILERQIIGDWQNTTDKVLVVRGLPSQPPTAITKANITLIPYLDDASLAAALTSAKVVISRSGYSSIMDYSALSLLDKKKRKDLVLTLVPTPGQPEQEYLASLHSRR